MSENNSGGCVWRALAEFLCALSPEQFILLPTLLITNIYGTTNADEQNLISNFFAVLGQGLSAITSQAEICEKNHPSSHRNKNGTTNSNTENEDSIKRTEQNERGQSSAKHAATVMTFE